MIKENFKNNKGFVILFAVTLAAILLSIALGITSIALKEINFGTSAKGTNEAFFAADAGIECARINDKSTSNSFVSSGSTGTISCLGNSISLNGAYPLWSFTLSGLGNTGQSCAKVTVDKSSLLPPTTTMIAKGYNNGGNTCVSSSSTIEREIKTSY